MTNNINNKLFHFHGGNGSLWILPCRYNDDQLPNVDIFVCTADPIIEPPVLVINTVLSAMAYDYPPEKLAIYLSDDGGSEFTFYALIEASNFSKHWLPFCRKFKVEPRSPEAYFSLDSALHNCSQEWIHMKVGNGVLQFSVVDVILLNGLCF